ncbi:MAG: hypothetical protein Q8O16_05870, partial [Dehalococcoidia bacterium]|nr:hypothetical protein [Dehalococcoidia bacterium]
LVRKGTAFRTAHEIVGKLVAYATKKGKTFAKLSLKDYKEFSPLFDEDVYKITAQSSISARNTVGGTAPQQVRRQLSRAKKAIRIRRATKQISPSDTQGEGEKGQ